MKNVIGYESHFKDLKALVESTMSRGESNSVLLLGPRGVGKTRLIDLILEQISNDDNGGGGSILCVRLNGLLQTDDKLALREITKQLRLENVVGDKVFGSFAEHLEFLLKSLRSGERTQSKPILFILDEFDLFASHHNQTLLYNLFDVAQSKAAPICVIGISAQLDVIERLEKRVRSRFSHRQIYMNNLDKEEDYFRLAESILAEERNISAKVKTANAKRLLRSVFDFRQDAAFLKQVLYLSLHFHPNDVFDRGLKQSLDYLNVQFDLKTIESLTLLEVALLISAKHMKVLYEDQPFNFEMAYHEFYKFVQRRGCTILKYDKPVVLKAFETLVSLELLTPVDKSSKAQKEYRLYSLQALPDQVVSVVQNTKTIPVDIKEWAASELH